MWPLVAVLKHTDLNHIQQPASIRAGIYTLTVYLFTPSCATFSKCKHQKEQMLLDDWGRLFSRLTKFKFSSSYVIFQPSPPIHLPHLILSYCSIRASLFPTQGTLLPSYCSSSGDPVQELMCISSFKATHPPLSLSSVYKIKQKLPIGLKSAQHKRPRLHHKKQKIRLRKWKKY